MRTGFEEVVYSQTEGSGSVEVCAEIVSPAVAERRFFLLLSSSNRDASEKICTIYPCGNIVAVDLDIEFWSVGLHQRNNRNFYIVQILYSLYYFFKPTPAINPQSLLKYIEEFDTRQINHKSSLLSGSLEIHRHIFWIENSWKC